LIGEQGVSRRIGGGMDEGWKEGRKEGMVNGRMDK